MGVSLSSIGVVGEILYFKSVTVLLMCFVQGDIKPSFQLTTLRPRLNSLTLGINWGILVLHGKLR
jgi:hypothetical protein